MRALRLNSISIVLSANNSIKSFNLNHFKTIMVLLLLSGTGVGYAQTNEDSIKKVTKKIITDKFPTARFFDLQYEHFSESDYDSKLYGEDFQKGTITEQTRLKAAFNIPILKKQKWTLSTSLRYKLESFDIANVKNVSQQLPSLAVTKSEDYHYFSGSMNFTYYSQLFNKTAIYNGSIIGDGSDEGFERLTGFVGASLVLQRTENTTMTIGLIALIDQTAQLPALPTFTYEHRFKKSPWTIDFILPRYLYFRRPLLKNGRLSVGSIFEGESFYTYNNQPGFANTYSYTRNEIKSGIVYEYHVSKDFITTFRAGVANVFNGRLTEKGKRQSDNILGNSQQASGYFSVGVSYNPFRN